MSTSADQSTLAIHADDALNVVPDVAPPIHLATTFRYAEDPDQLIPASIAGVRASLRYTFFLTELLALMI